MKAVSARVAARWCAAALIALVGAGIVASPAGAAVSCSWAGGTLTVDLTTAGDSAVLRVTGSGGFEFDAGGGFADCAGGGTTANTDLVDVNGTTGGETFEIDLSGGPFAPGATPES